MKSEAPKFTLFMYMFRRLYTPTKTIRQTEKWLKSAVKIDNKLTESFTCHAWVKQGYMLSPTLFNLYLSDLLKFLNTATDVLENVKSCKNLGLIMSPFGNLNLARQELKKVALKAL